MLSNYDNLNNEVLRLVVAHAVERFLKIVFIV